MDENVIKMGKRIEMLNQSKKIELIPEIELEKCEKKVIKAVHAKKDAADFLTICRTVDYKPSKLTKTLDKLVKKKLIEVKNDMIQLTDSGLSYASVTKRQKKNNKQFKKFIHTLTDEEFKEFSTLCETLKSDIGKVGEPVEPKENKLPTQE